MRNPRILGCVSLLAVAVSGSCTGGDTLDLHVGVDPSDPRFDELRGRLAIEVRPTVVGGFSGDTAACTEDIDRASLLGCCNTAFCSARGLSRLLEAGCWAILDPARAGTVTSPAAQVCTTAGPGPATNRCANCVRATDVQICVANRLLQIIEHPADWDFEASSTGAPLRVPPQDAESNGEIALEAIERAATAIRNSALALNTPAICARTPVPAGTPPPTTGHLKSPASQVALATTHPLGALSLGEELASFYRDGFEAARDASEHVATAGAAVSDTEHSRSIDPAEASLMRMAPFASRVAAAHALVGGAHGLPALPGVADDGFFTRPRLSRAAAHALAILRTAAIDPRLVVDEADTVSLTALLVGGTALPDPADTIRYRASRFLGETDLESATEGVLLERLGTSSEALLEARAWLAGEILAFDRPHGAAGSVRPSRPLSAETLPDGSETDYVLYAGTRLPPAQLSPTLWSTLLRYDDTPSPLPSGSALPSWGGGPPGGASGLFPGETWGDEAFGLTAGSARLTRDSGRTFGSVVYDATRYSGYLLGIIATDGPAITATRDTLASVTADALGGSVEGRVRAVFERMADGVRRIRLELELAPGTPTPLGRIIVVKGHDGLDCATRGTIDGVPCTQAELDASRVGVNCVWTAIPSVPNGYGCNVGFDPTSGPAPDTALLSLVSLRAGTMGEVGDYDGLAGFLLPLGAAGTGFRYWVSTPIIPDIDRRAAELVGPSTEYPGRSAISCAGLPDDFSIPLENELLDDTASGDADLESSWRHFVALARTSADEADALGEDLVRAGLEMDLRAEAQTDELERLCGVRLNVTGFAGTLPPRVIDTAGACPAGYERPPTLGPCLLDPISWAATTGALSSADAQSLRSCIGEDSTLTVALGDQPVCFWRYPGIVDSFCLNADSEHPCPVALPGADAVADCAPGLPGPVAGPSGPVSPQATLVTEHLSLFHNPDPPRTPPPSPSEWPCEALARLRSETFVPPPCGPGLLCFFDDVLTRVLSSPLIDQAQFRAAVLPLNWEASAGDYSRVTYNNTTIASTGSFGVAPTLLWPGGESFGGASVFTSRLCPPGGSAVADPAGHNGPLFCVANVPDANGGAGRRARARANDLLARAVIAARVLAGATLTNLRMPFYPRTNAQSVTAPGAEEELVRGALFASDGGSLNIDQSLDEFSPPSVVVGLSDLRATRERIVDPATALCADAPCPSAEWSRCPYQPAGTPCIDFFDDATDADDVEGADHNLPLVIRRPAVGVDIPSAEVRVREFFGDSGGLAFFLRGVRRTGFGNNSFLGDPRTLSDYFIPDNDSCRGQHNDCVSVEATTDFRSRVGGNAAYIGYIAPVPFTTTEYPGLSGTDILNGLELTCAAARGAGPNPDFGCDRPIEITSVRDLLHADAFLTCKANAVSAIAAATVTANVPAGVVAALRATGPTVLGTNSGEMARQVAILSSAYIALSDQEYAIADTLRLMAADLRDLRRVVGESEIAGEIESLALQSTIMDHVASCASAALGAISSGADIGGAIGDASAAAVTCGNDIAQSALANSISGLRHRELALALEGQFAAFDSRATLHMRDVSEHVIAIRTALQEINGALAAISSLRADGRRALARALFLESDETNLHFAVSSAYRARYNTLLARYGEAHERAVRLAFIARRAVEQRLAMPLDTIVDDLVTVEAPAHWADDICSLPSIDYDRIRAATPGDELVGPEGFAGAFVGDYVRRLEQVVESYNFAFPFRDGADTVVLSLRDDIFRTRGACGTETPNWLFQSGHLDVPAGVVGDSDPTRPGWGRTDCDSLAVPEPTDDSPWRAHCASARRLSADEDPTLPVLPHGGDDFGRPNLFSVHFAGSDAAGPDTEWVQRVELPAGRYRISWYGRAPRVGTMNEVAPRDAVFVRDLGGGALYLGTRTGSELPVEGPALDGGWRRYHFLFDVSVPEAVTVALSPRFPGGAPEERFLAIGGLMIEQVTRSVEGNVWSRPGGPGTSTLAEIAGPGPYFDTGETRERELASCPDTSGAALRASAFTWGCTRTCPSGYDGTCSDAVAGERCYHQTTFPIASDFLERVLTGTPTGFASGNYNYRIETVGVNVVGTGLRDCVDAGCFGSGNVSYSLLHHGPFLIPNARGEVYDAPLFPGRIESARALLAERVITNPISSADSALLGPYTRADFQGRALGGTMMLRVWDEPTLVWDRVEDIQLVINYRYWTHQR